MKEILLPKNEEIYRNFKETFRILSSDLEVLIKLPNFKGKEIGKPQSINDYVLLSIILIYSSWLKVQKSICII